MPLVVLLVEDNAGDVRLTRIKDFWLTKARLPQQWQLA